MTEQVEQPTRNLLTEPLLRMEWKDGGLVSRTLPGVLADLESGEPIGGFPGLQPHQWPAWHTFLVQVAALATLTDSENLTPRTEGKWRDRLRALTPEYPRDEPWCLFVPDLGQPAFMQPPVPENSLTKFEGPYRAPDASALDVLVSATDHDIKIQRQIRAESDHWSFGLVTYQTHSGYSGPKNYGVIRMNGGYATRPLVGLAWSQDWSDLFQRDLPVLREKHDQLAKEHGLPVQGGWHLLWLAPWDGATSIPWADCDPYVIEVARRVRLLEQSGKLHAYRRSTQAPRLSPKSDVLKGNVGDPWTPVNAEGQAANVSAGGWSYDRTRQILLGDGYNWSACQHPREDDPPELTFYAAGLARGQGKTEGFHERWIRVPGHITHRLFSPVRRQDLGEIAQERVSRTAEVRKVLHRALVILLASAPDHRPDFRDNRDRRWLDAFEAHVDTLFFGELWADADKDRRIQRTSWARVLCGIVEGKIWPEAEAEAPVADARRERGQARAWMVLRGGLKKVIPEAYEEREEDHHAAG